jgi:hypothetical protein
MTSTTTTKPNRSSPSPSPSPSLRLYLPLVMPEKCPGGARFIMGENWSPAAWCRHGAATVLGTQRISSGTGGQQAAVEAEAEAEEEEVVLLARSVTGS